MVNKAFRRRNGSFDASARDALVGDASARGPLTRDALARGALGRDTLTRHVLARHALARDDRGVPAVSTYSIVGFDPETGDLGIAVQSKFFGVGAVVPYAKAGVGAIATQSWANTTYGPKALALLELGLPVQSVADALVAEDDNRGMRQFGLINAQGEAAAFTGDKCMPWAGHISGDYFTCQGNILVDENTVRAMADSFSSSTGPLTRRLADALAAGQEAGGDSRGQQSAALLVVREGGGYSGFNDRYCDLRVDDHERPIEELLRLLDVFDEFQLLLAESRRKRESGD